MTEMTEVQARAEYAKWFVRDYYLQKWSVDYSYAAKIERAQRRGFIRYKKLTWPVGSKAYPEGYERLQEEDDYDHFPILGANWRPEASWFRLAWEDLDNPLNDDNLIVRDYRGYRERAAENELVLWLQAEAEFNKVTAEAWLRSYGVDIQSP